MAGATNAELTFGATKAMRCASVLAAVTLLLIWSSRPLAQDTFAELDTIVSAELAETNTPGAAVALVKGDRVVYARGFGVASVESGEKVEPGMLFRLGSTTKMFTATAAVLAVLDGKLKIADPIGRVVPGLHQDIARLTLHQLLSHTSGLSDAAPMFGRHDEAALGDEVRRLTAANLFTEPGQVYSYSNPGYWVAGFVAAHADGKLYADLVADRLFTPLGMTRSTFRPTLAMTWPLAQGHESQGGAAPRIIRPAANNAGSWPAGSIFSSVIDLSRFVIAFMNDGRLDGRQAIPPQAIAMVSGRHAEIPGRDTAHYGYGLNTSLRQGRRLVQHGGSRAGYGSAIAMFPDDRVAVVVLANRTGSGMPKTSRRALDLLLGIPTSTEPEEAVRPITAGEARDAAGRYAQGANDAIELVANGATLALKIDARDVPLRKLGPGRYQTTPQGSAPALTIVTTPGPDGRPLYVHRGGRAFKRVTGRPVRTQASDSERCAPASRIIPPRHRSAACAPSERSERYAT